MRVCFSLGERAWVAGSAAKPARMRTRLHAVLACSHGVPGCLPGPSRHFRAILPSRPGCELTIAVVSPHDDAGDDAEHDACRTGRQRRRKGAVGDSSGRRQSGGAPGAVPRRS